MFLNKRFWISASVASLGTGGLAAYAMLDDGSSVDVPQKGADAPPPIRGLLLPGEKVSHYHQSTDTILQPVCTVEEDEKAASCRLQVYSKVSHLAYTQTDKFKEIDGKIVVTSKIGPSKVWLEDTLPEFDRAFNKARYSARVRKWTGGSTLATKYDLSNTAVVQNEVAQVSANGATNVCSDVPISPRFGYSICITFDQVAEKVEMRVIPRVERVTSYEEILAHPAKVTRAFSEQDNSNFSAYLSALGPDYSPSYVLIGQAPSLDIK